MINYDVLTTTKLFQIFASVFVVFNLSTTSIAQIGECFKYFDDKKNLYRLLLFLRGNESTRGIIELYEASESGRVKRPLFKHPPLSGHWHLTKAPGHKPKIQYHFNADNTQTLPTTNTLIILKTEKKRRLILK